MLLPCPLEPSLPLPLPSPRLASLLQTALPLSFTTYRSWFSRLRLFLLLRAIRVLELFLRAGPTLMLVFSRAVVLSATLLPLCRRETAGRCYNPSQCKPPLPPYPSEAPGNTRGNNAGIKLGRAPTLQDSMWKEQRVTQEFWAV